MCIGFELTCVDAYAHKYRQINLAIIASVAPIYFLGKYYV